MLIELTPDGTNEARQNDAGHQGSSSSFLMSFANRVPFLVQLRQCADATRAFSTAWCY
jgi:hypothetical protein